MAVRLPPSVVVPANHPAANPAANLRGNTPARADSTPTRPLNTASNTTSNTTPSAANADFANDIFPKPMPAASYAATFSFIHRWNELTLSPTSGAAGPQLPSFVEAGKPFTVNYNRSPQDIGQQGTVASVDMFYRVGGSNEVKTAKIADGSRDMRSGQLLYMPAKLDIPAQAKGDLEYWFRMKTTDGRELWDSDFGKNFHATIVPQGGSTIKFDENWDEKSSGPVYAGETLRLAYDSDRLKQFLRGTSHHGGATWHVSAFVSFNDRPAVELPITVPERGAQGGMTVDMNTHEVAIAVPDDATKVSVWFRGSSYGGSVHNLGGPAWDSDMGRNYTFAVQQR